MEGVRGRDKQTYKFNQARMNQIYTEYLQSEEWKYKREEVFLSKWKLCQKCWSDQYLHIHHWTYLRLWKEKMKDLFVLCWSCHKKLHEIYGMKDLLRATKCFITGEEYKPRVKKKPISNQEILDRIDHDEMLIYIKSWGKFKKNPFTKRITIWRKFKRMMRKWIIF